MDLSKLALGLAEWFFFSIVLSLIHLPLALRIVSRLGNKLRREDLVKDGSLLFFAATLAATSFGNFFHSVSYVSHPWWFFGAFASGFVIILWAAVTYGSIVTALCGGSSYSSGFIYADSLTGAIASSVYGAVLSLVIAQLSGPVNP